MKKRNPIMSLFVSLTNACDILMMTRSNLQVKWFFCILPPECPGDMNLLMGWNGEGLEREHLCWVQESKILQWKEEYVLSSIM